MIPKLMSMSGEKRLSCDDSGSLSAGSGPSDRDRVFIDMSLSSRVSLEFYLMAQISK